MIRYVCDRCCVTENADKGLKGELRLPKGWRVVTRDQEGTGVHHACSPECARVLSNQKTAPAPRGILCET